MMVSITQRALLDRQADRIERAFSELALPIRVLGGEVSGEEVRYHLSPNTPASWQDLEQAAETVAETLGAPGLSVLRERETIALSIRVDLDEPLRLLPLLNVIGNVPGLHAVLGMSEEKKPLVLNFEQEANWHLLIQGPAGCGKSELLRTVLFSLALNSRPSQVQFLGIDLTGRELTPLDALPHTFAELATELEYAGGLLHWLKDEVERRLAFHVIRPDILLVIDQADRLLNSGPEHVRETLRFLAGSGRSCGVHLLLIGGSDRGSGLPGLFRSKPVVLRGRGPNGSVQGSPGRFELQRGRGIRHFRAAWLPAQDLHAAVALARNHKRGGR